MSRNIPRPNESFWDKEVFSGEIRISDVAKYTTTICFKDDKRFVSLTRWYCTKKNPDWKPKNGIVLPLEKSSEIIRALQTATIQGQEL